MDFAGSAVDFAGSAEWTRNGSRGRVACDWLCTTEITVIEFLLQKCLRCLYCIAVYVSGNYKLYQFINIQFFSDTDCSTLTLPWMLAGSATGIHQWIFVIEENYLLVSNLWVFVLHIGFTHYVMYIVWTDTMGDFTFWWHGIVGNAFQLKRSYSTPGMVSTAMGDCLRAGKPSRCEACQLGRLSLLPSVGRWNE